MRNFIFVILLGFVTTMSAQSYTSRLNNLKDFNTAISKGERYKSATSSSNSSNSGALHTDNTSHPFDPDEIVDCIFCRGGGQIPYGFTLIQCPHCLGSGKQTAGKYMRNVTLPNNATYNGGYNGGSVGSSSIRQERDLEQEKRDVLNRTYGEKCRACSGSGKCRACNGTKVARSFGNTYECTCRNGNCGACNGTGKTSWNR